MSDVVDHQQEIFFLSRCRGPSPGSTFHVVLRGTGVEDVARVLKTLKNMADFTATADDHETLLSLGPLPDPPEPVGVDRNPR